MKKVISLKNQHSRPQNTFLLVFCLSVVLGINGCDQKGPAEQAGKKIDQATEKTGKQLEIVKDAVVNKAEAAEEYVDDSVITAKVKEALLADNFLKATEIEVTTTAGVVKLTGMVDTEQLSARAEGLVKTQKSVKSVDNQLLSKPTPTAK